MAPGIFLRLWNLEEHRERMYLDTKEYRADSDHRSRHRIRLLLVVRYVATQPIPDPERAIPPSYGTDTLPLQQLAAPILSRHENPKVLTAHYVQASMSRPPASAICSTPSSRIRGRRLGARFRGAARRKIPAWSTDRWSRRPRGTMCYGRRGRGRACKVQVRWFEAVHILRKMHACNPP